MRKDAEEAHSEAETVRREVLTVQDQLEEATVHLSDMQRDQQTANMELELQKLREMEELRRDFDQECRQHREAREREVNETRECRNDMIVERNQQQELVDQLKEQAGHYSQDDKRGGGSRSVSIQESPVESEDINRERVTDVQISTREEVARSLDLSSSATSAPAPRSE